jgi:hypothetical protein
VSEELLNVSEIETIIVDYKEVDTEIQGKLSIDIEN